MDARNSSKEPGGFWEAYRACVEENRVRPDRAPFYVSWARDFANFLPGKPLKDRSRKDKPFWLTLGYARASSLGLLGMIEHYQKRIAASTYLNI